MEIGKFYPEGDLMHQLDMLDSEDNAKKWWEQYLKYHGQDQGVKYLIGYFASEQKRNNLYKWLK